MAEVTLEQAIEIALQHQRAGDLAQAEQIYRQVLAVDPNHHNALQLLGVIAYAGRRYQEAVLLLTRAIAAEPNVAHYHNNLASALLAMGRKQEAVAAYQHAVRLDPAAIEARLNLADLLSDMGRLDQAITHYEAAVKLDPTRVDALNNLGMALQSAGRPSDAADRYAQALRLKPNSAEVQANSANVLLDTGRIGAAIEQYRAAIRLGPHLAHVHSNLLYALHFDPSLDRQTIFREHLKWAADRASPLASEIRPHSNDRDPERRLRIGYLSQDFRDHPVGRFVLPLLKHHDRERFEVHVYSDVQIEDEITARSKTLVAHWHPVNGRPAADVAQLVRDTQIDILIDLSGHVGVGRLPVFARKPAPVQVTGLGYPDTTGLATMDYRITDAMADPTDEFHTEKLVRLPHGFLCYESDGLPPVTPSPAARNGYVTFGSFNNFAKVSPGAMQLWARVLDAVPGSRLLIKSQAMGDPRTRDDARARLIAHGIPGDRLFIVGRTKSHESHLAAYADVDIALDTFPYNGTTTTLDALAMGVPVVSLVGDRHAGRMGLSILMHAGFTEWIAHTPDDYVSIATGLAAALPDRSSVRQTLMNSPVANGPQITRDFESAYRQMWLTWCQSSLT